MVVKRCISFFEMARLHVGFYNRLRSNRKNGWTVRVRCLPASDLFLQYTSSVHVLSVAPFGMP